MLSDKSSFLLVVLVTLGFSISGMLDILDNFVVITLLLIGIIVVIANLFTYNKTQDQGYEKPIPKEEDFEDY